MTTPTPTPTPTLTPSTVAQVMTEAQAKAIMEGAPGAPTDLGDERAAWLALYGPGGYLAQEKAASIAASTAWPVTAQYGPPPQQLATFLATIQPWQSNLLASNEMLNLDYAGPGGYLATLDTANNALYQSYVQNYSNARSNSFVAVGTPVYPPPQPMYGIGLDLLSYYVQWVSSLGGYSSPNSPGGVVSQTPASLQPALLLNSFNYAAAIAQAQTNMANQAQQQPALGALLQGGLAATQTQGNISPLSSSVPTPTPTPVVATSAISATSAGLKLVPGGGFTTPGNILNK